MSWGRGLGHKSAGLLGRDDFQPPLLLVALSLQCVASTARAWGPWCVAVAGSRLPSACGLNGLVRAARGSERVGCACAVLRLFSLYGPCFVFFCSSFKWGKGTVSNWAFWLNDFFQFKKISFRLLSWVSPIPGNFAGSPSGLS